VLATLLVAVPIQAGPPPQDVPAGKRLVIEQASVRAQLGSGTHAAMPFLRTFAPSLGGFYIPLTPLGAFAGMGEVQIGSEHMRAYAVAGRNVDVSITVDTATSGGSRFEVTFAGYLVDA
jgi:hypothetical protein